MLRNYQDKMLRVPFDKDPRRWAILASGPSLTKEDAEAVRGLNVCVINSTHWLAPWADLLYACDPHWWDWQHQNPELKAKLDAFEGEKWTQIEGKDINRQKDDLIAVNKYGLRYIKSLANPGLSSDPQFIHQGSNSGIQAINLVIHRGAKEIILLGYDLSGSAEKPRWHGHHPNKVISNWDRWVPLYTQVASDADRMGVKIINCSRNTALKCFPRMALTDALSILSNDENRDHSRDGA